MPQIYPVREVLPFRGFLKESYCQVNLYKLPNTVVIISELKANHGTSAVNCIKRVVSQLTEKYNLDPQNTRFIHHCPEGQGMFFSMEDFHEVPIRWNGREYEHTVVGPWQLLSRSQVEELIGSPFEN